MSVAFPGHIYMYAFIVRFIIITDRPHDFNVVSAYIDASNVYGENNFLDTEKTGNIFFPFYRLLFYLSFA